MAEFTDAARRMGFDVLKGSGTSEIIRLIKVFLRKNINLKSEFNSEKKTFSITTGEPRS